MKFSLKRRSNAERSISSGPVLGLRFLIITPDSHHPNLISPIIVVIIMNQNKFDFSRPSGEVGLLLLALSFIAYAIWLNIYILDIWSSILAGRTYFAMASIFLVIALVLLAYNYRPIKMSSKKMPDWIVLKNSSAQILPPVCQNCSSPARWVFEFGWFCDKCNFWA